MENLKNWLKNNWQKILIFILLIIFGFFFHIFILFSGAIVYLTLFSTFVFLIFSLSIFKTFYKKLLFFVFPLLFIQVLIYLIPFPKCTSNFKVPLYGCECSGIKKEYLGGSECIGKIKKCYEYWGNSNIKKEKFWELYNENKYRSEFEVPCDSRIKSSKITPKYPLIKDWK